MERYLITLDGGTTNTRAALWTLGGDCRALETAAVGVRNTAIDGHNRQLQAGVKACIDRLLAAAGITPAHIAAVYGSGMITSNVGLVEIPHLTAPAGTAEFIRAVTAVTLPEVSPLPIHFIPGLKNHAGPIGLEQVETQDIMRGEETEAIALLHWLETGRDYLLALPGSHSKFITVDADGRMTGCLTSLAGEILALLTSQSILADAVGHQFVTETTYRPELMLAGFRTAAGTSFARAAFSTRILNQFVSKDPADGANFLLGAVLANDVAAVKTSDALTASADATVVVAGKEPLRSALVDVFRQDGFFREVIAFAPPEGVALSGYGAYLVAKAREGW
ncbi:MAG: 2-dehydro-3-deoxygalactonokinase [Planctomycetes bacterium]|nr:2-dehydro-3-deoxygalactonokinase [Planctomycetota bacterium]